MGQYLQYRSWLRKSAGGEKAIAGTAAVLVVGLTAWALVPTGSSAGGTSALLAPEPGQVPEGVTGSSAPGQSPIPLASGAALPGSTPGTSGGPAPTFVGGTGPVGPGGSGGTPSPNSPTSPPAGCGTLTSTDQGVTSTQIRIAVVTLKLAGAIGNSAIGLATEEQQQQMARAMVDEVNSHGGIACRKLAITFFSGNPIDPSTAQQACLDIVQGKFFATIDFGGFSYPPGAADCVARNKIPVIASGAPTPKEAKQFYPYIMSLSGDPTRVQRDAIKGMAERGWFTAAQGFKKLGLLIDDCSPEVNDATYSALASVGIAKNQISIASVSCPSGGFASPAAMQAAVIQHNRAGVTNVIPVIGGGSFKTYSAAAAQQGYKPKYTTTDYDGFAISATGATGPDPGNFDGTVSVTSTRVGANTSGITDPATQNCIAIFKRHGLPADWVINTASAKYYQGGNYCSLFLTFQAAVNRAPAVTRPNVVVGLTRLGKVPLAYLYQDAVFDRPDKVTGGDYWWVIQFSQSCTCWKVIDKRLHPTFG